MNLLEILGCIGGTLFLIGWIVKDISTIVEFVRKHEKYKNAYEKSLIDSEEEAKKKMGFKSKEDELKELDEKYEKLFKEKIKTVTDEGYFDMYWQTEPVDNEFIEDDYEDWEDKYPNLHVER